MKSRRPATVFAALALTGGLVAGCSQRADILMNPTPELSTLTQREVDLQNDFSYSANVNFRNLRRDWEVLWLRNDGPSTLSAYPIR
jgi:hypothetical protein